MKSTTDLLVCRDTTWRAKGRSLSLKMGVLSLFILRDHDEFIVGLINEQSWSGNTANFN